MFRLYKPCFMQNKSNLVKVGIALCLLLGIMAAVIARAKNLNKEQN